MKDHCSDCDCSVRNSFIPIYGFGNLNATIAWVSSIAPTKTEVKKGIFGLPRYEPLLQAFIEYGFNDANSYFTHIIKCKMTRPPSSIEVMNCRSNLGQELASLPNLKIIVLIGSIAFRVFLETSLSKYVNTPIYNTFVFIGIQHPDFITLNNQKYNLSLIKQLHEKTLGF